MAGVAPRYEVAILDCPPSISLASESVFGAADALLEVIGEGATHVVVDITMHASHGMHWHDHTVTRQPGWRISITRTPRETPRRQ